MAGHPAAAAANVFVEYDLGPYVRDVISRDAKNLSVVLVPRGLFGANGEPLPVAAQAVATLGSVHIIQR